MQGMKLKSKRLLYVLALLIILGAAGTYALSAYSKHIVKQGVSALLEANEIEAESFAVTTVTAHQLTLKDIVLGNKDKTDKQQLGKAELTFTPKQLINGMVNDLTIEHMEITARKEKDAWVLAGLPMQQSKNTTKSTFTLPVSTQELKAIPIQTASIQNSHINLFTKEWSLHLPVELTWAKEPIPTLTYTATEGLVYQFKKYKIKAGGLKAQVTLDPNKKAWGGSWSVSELNISGLDTPIPALHGAGTLSATQDRLIIEGTFKSDDQKTSINFKLSSPLNAPNNSKLTLIKARVPWSQGTISTQDIVWNFGKEKDIAFTLRVKRISLNDVLNQLVGDRAKGTGLISGSLPLKLSKEGKLTAHKGKLSAESNGVIQMSPDLIPGDNAQVSFVREVLKNLNYKTLTLGIDSKSAENLQISMSVEGRNRDIDATRPVKLNVKLEGNMIDFVEQSLLSVLNPRQLLERSRHAKP